MCRYYSPHREWIYNEVAMGRKFEIECIQCKVRWMVPTNLGRKIISHNCCVEKLGRLEAEVRMQRAKIKAQEEKKERVLRHIL